MRNYKITFERFAWVTGCGVKDWCPQFISVYAKNKSGIFNSQQVQDLFSDPMVRNIEVTSYGVKIKI